MDNKKSEETDNPRALGLSLKGQLSDYWRYRIGDYRIIVEIKDKELIISIIEVGHRKSIYE